MVRPGRHHGTTRIPRVHPRVPTLPQSDIILGWVGGSLASELKRLLMTTTPAAGPSAPADNKTTPRLSRLLKRPVADSSGEDIGRLADVIVRVRGADYPLVTGLVAAVGGREIFVPIDQVASFDEDPIRLSSARLSLRHFERREGEVLLRRDVLGHRLIDVPNARLVRAADLELAKHGDDWVLAGVDTRRRPRRLFGLLGPDKQDEADVFEELDEDLATRLLGARTDEEIAAVLTRMRADDAADAITELPQRRRQRVLDLLPPGQRTKVL